MPAEAVGTDGDCHIYTADGRSSTTRRWIEKVGVWRLGTARTGAIMPGRPSPAARHRTCARVTCGCVAAQD
jgi:hypothetical protein